MLEGEFTLQVLPEEFMSGTGHSISCKAVINYCGNRVWGGYAYKYPKKKQRNNDDIKINQFNKVFGCYENSGCRTISIC